MSRLNAFYMDSTDAKSRLHVMQWLPDDEKVTAVLQIAHGISEHIARYDAFARFMAENGFIVIGNDHLGHGQTSGETQRGIFSDKNGWDTAVSDMLRLHEESHARYPTSPHFLLGHSMGSFLAQTFIIRHPDLLAGCILSGTGYNPMLLVNTGLIIAAAEKKLFGADRQSVRLDRLSFGSYNRRIPQRRTPRDWLSRDSELVDRYLSDDACGFVPSAGMFHDMLSGIKFIEKEKNIAGIRKTLPVLFISGSEDPVGNYGKGAGKVRDLFTKAGLHDVTFKLYDGARHEVLNETNRQEVYSDVLRWVQLRAPGS